MYLIHLMSNLRCTKSCVCLSGVCIFDFLECLTTEKESERTGTKIGWCRVLNSKKGLLQEVEPCRTPLSTTVTDFV